MMSYMRFLTMNTVLFTVLNFSLLIHGQQFSQSVQNLAISRLNEDSHSSRNTYGRSFDPSSVRFNNPPPHNDPYKSSNNGPVIFSDNESPNEGRSRVAKSTKPIPLSFMKKLSNGSLDFIFRKYVTNVNVLTEAQQGYILVNKTTNLAILGANNKAIVISNQEHGPNVHETDGSLKRVGGQSVTQLSERTASKPQSITQPAACQPESRTVELSVNFDPHIVYMPRCVRLDRCGGCCATDILRCEAVETKPVEVVVSKFEYIGEENLNFLKQEAVTMEHHTKCECGCRVKEQDCSSRHVYLAEECQCTCRDRADHERCILQQHKIWDSSTCECVCRDIKDCNSGHVFSLRTCQCELLPSTAETPKRRGRKRRIPIQHQ